MAYCWKFLQKPKSEVKNGNMAQREIKKMKQGMSYSCKEKTIILNVFKYFHIIFPDLCVTEIVRRTAKATGCSEKSIFQFRKEEASAEGFKAPSTTKIRRNININSRDIKYDQSVRQAIKNTIYDLKYKNIVPSLNTILKQVNGDPQLPNFSLMTLRRLMFDMGFCYEKNGNKSVLVEKTPALKKDVKDVKKELALNKNTKKETRILPDNNIPQQNYQAIDTSISKPIPQMPQSIPNHPQPHHQVIPEQNHRLVPMHIPHENHMHMHMAHHSMPMVMNHQMPPGPDINMHLKHQMHWMHPPQPMMKQE